MSSENSKNAVIDTCEHCQCDSAHGKDDGVGLHSAGSAGSAGNPSGLGDLALFHRSLAEMCRAQVPLPKALRLLQGDLGNGHLGKATKEMATEIEEGLPLPEAYARHRDQFPPLYCALVEAGIQAGDLPGVLEEVATHASARAAVAARLRKALTYPFVSLLFVFLIAVFLLFYMTPRMTDLAAIANVGNVGNTRVGLPTGSLFVVLGLCTLLVSVATVLALAWFRNPLEPGAGPRGLAYRLPLFGRLRQYAAKASFASTMALLTRRNVPLPQALTLAAAATDDKAVRQQVERMAHWAAEGASLYEAVRAGDLIPTGTLWFVQAGEASGTVTDALEDIARLYRQRLERAVDRLCVLATPGAELLVGAVVLGFALAYTYPILTFFDRMSNF